MKKLVLFILCLIFVLFSASCTIINGEGEEKIISPSNNTPPLLGKWVVEEVILASANSLSNRNPETIERMEALFHKDGVVLGEMYTKTPNFKIKTVDTIDYLLYKYKISPGLLGIEDDKIEVITILDDKQFLGEFIKISEDTIIVNIEDFFCRMERVVNEVSMEEVNRYIDIESTKLRTYGQVQDENLQTGVLLGLKTPVYHEETQLPGWDYKTIWINSQKGNIVGIYELDGLLLPRKNGFWRIHSNRVSDSNSVIDELSAEQTTISKDMMVEEELGLFSENEIALRAIQLPSIIRNIQFLGNDYMSVENIDLDRGWRRTLQVYSIDNLKELRPIKLSDLIGETGTDIFTESSLSVITNDMDTITNEENVGLVRNNGYWIMRGRVNHKANNEEMYKDFNIKIVPPKEMVSYDEQIIPWEAVKLLIPDVKDVFSSPNGEFIVAVTSRSLEIYRVENGEIINSPIEKIDMPYDTSIIMSEWAVGRYANIWQNEIIKNNGVAIED